MKKCTARTFSRALLKLLCQSFHRPLASRSPTLLIFAPGDVVRIHGIGWRSRSLSAFCRMCKVSRDSVGPLCGVAVICASDRRWSVLLAQWVLNVLQFLTVLAVIWYTWETRRSGMLLAHQYDREWKPQ